MSGNGGGPGERNGRSGNGGSGPRSRPGGAFGPGGLIRPPIVSEGGQDGARRPSNPRSQMGGGRSSNPKSTLGRMHAPSRSEDQQSAPREGGRSGGARRSMGGLARDLSRSMSRSLASLGQSFGRAVRDAGRYEGPPTTGEHTGANHRISLPPDVMAQMALNQAPYRRSRARMLARKWRLGRVRANPIAAASILAIMSVLLGVVAGGGGVGAYYGMNVYDAHKTEINGIYGLKFGQSTQIYDRNGQLLYTARNDKGIQIYAPLIQIDKKVQLATIDTEDPSFYSNIGVDFQALVRALVANSNAGGNAQGGSTITQQLAKNIILNDRTKSVQRKLDEMFISLGITQSYTKGQILEMYLNSIDYGDQNQGIEAASRNFFGLQADQAAGVMANQKLTWAQTALLVALPNAPGKYNPLQTSCKDAPCPEEKWDNPCKGNPHDSVCVPNLNYSYLSDGHEWLDYRRGLLVLDKLHQYKDISDADYNQAKNELHDILVYQKVYHWAAANTGNAVASDKLAPHFVDYILDQLVRDYGIEDPERAGLKIYTTLDYNLDKYAEDQLKYYILQKHEVKWIHYCGGYDCKNVPPLAQTADAHNGAMIAIDPHTGDILSMVGSVDYGNADKKIAGFIDMTGANQSMHVSRSMGSSVKGLVYGLAFQMGWNPATVVQDQPVCFDVELPPINDPGQPDDGQPVHNDHAPACEGLYAPTNFNLHSFSGNAPIRVALGNSLNIPATEAMSFVEGANSVRTTTNFMAWIQRLGITTIKPGRLGPSAALGTVEIPLIELANAYATYANAGKHLPYRSILRIETADGTPLYQAPAAPQGQQVMSPQTAYMLTSVLCDDKARVADFNFNNPLTFPDCTVAAKTGTAQGLKGPSDIVTMGYSPYLALGVWIGNTDNSDMAPGTIGIAGAGYVFNDVMTWAMKNYNWPKYTNFPVPPHLARGQFNCVTGLAPYAGETPAPCPLNPYAPGSTNLYAGWNTNAKLNEDWYIQGQAPLQS